MNMQENSLQKKIEYQYAAVSEAAGELKRRFIAMPRRTKVLSLATTVLGVAGAAVFLRYAGFARGRRMYAYFLLGKNVADTLAQLSNKQRKEIVPSDSNASSSSSLSSGTEVEQIEEIKQQ